MTAGTVVAVTGSTAAIVASSIAYHPTIAGANTLWDQGTLSAKSPVMHAGFQHQTVTDGIGYTVTVYEYWQADDGVHFQNYKEEIDGIYIHYDLINQDYWSGSIATENTGNDANLTPVTGTATNATQDGLIWEGGAVQSGCGSYMDQTRVETWVHGFEITPCQETSWSTSGYYYLDPQINVTNGVKSITGWPPTNATNITYAHVMSGLH